MTRFEGTDLQTTPAVLDLTAASGGKFQEDYLSAIKFDAKQGASNQGDAKFVKVADNIQQAQAAPDAGAGDSGDGGKFDVKTLLQADPKELPPSLRTLQGLAEHFDKAGDKTKAMADIKPEVEKAVKAADDANAAAQAQGEKAMATLKPQFEAEKIKITAAAGKVQDILKTIPPEDAKHVGAELGLLMDPKSSPALKKAVEADLASHKGLVPAVKAFADEQKIAKPIVEKIQALGTAAQEGMGEAVLTRMVYADMLTQSGDAAGAKQVMAESVAVQMGVSPAEFKALSDKRKQQQTAPAAPGDNK